MAYSTQEGVELYFGASNVAKWADLDNEGDADVIAARVAAAIDSADTRIDDELRGGPYTVPFEDEVPAIITDLSRKLAGIDLYGARGSIEIDEATGERINRYGALERACQRLLSRLHSGSLRLSLAQSSEVPEQVSDDEDTE